MESHHARIEILHELSHAHAAHAMGVIVPHVGGDASNSYYEKGWANVSTREEESVHL